MGPFKYDVTVVEEAGRYPKLVTANGIGGGTVHTNSDITTKKTLCKFLFLLIFGQRGCSRPFVSVPAMVLFQVLLECTCAG